MTNRERFKMLMEGDARVDASPVIEWASWWDKTLEGWKEEGMPENMTEKEICGYFGLDLISQFWFDHYTPRCPKPEVQGPGLITGEEDYLRIRPDILPMDAVEQMMGQIQGVLPDYQKGDCLVWYTINGFFWFPRELFGVENHLYSFYDEPELYHKICSDLADWHIHVINEFAKYMKADFMTIAEDMSYNLGPMISEEMFREFMLPYYKKIIPEIKKYGTKVFVDSDGDISKAIPWFLEAGVDGVLPLERQAGVDLIQYRKEFPNLLMIGGFDKMCMLKGKEEIEAEVERLLPVLRSGRYLIGMDHQTPPGVTMENYRFYLSLLRKYGIEACRDL